MTINFFEPGDVPQHRDNLKIEVLEADVYEDRQRVKISLHVTPFLERPNLAVRLITDDEQMHTVGEMSIVETMHRKMEFTLHIRSESDPHGDYRLQSRLYFQDIMATDEDEAKTPVIIDEKEIQVHIPEFVAEETGARGYMDSEESQYD